MPLHSLDVVQSAAWVLLETLDAVLVAAFSVLSVFSSVVGLLLRDDSPKPSVVIVGASFAGLWAQRALAGRFDVTVIDLKDYFEYTPGVLRLFVEPQHMRHIAKPIPRRHNKVVVAEVTQVNEHSVDLFDHVKGEASSLPFDYLILACGSLYPKTASKDVVKAGSDQTSLEQRLACWEAAATDIAQAESALIVGAGPVGVELAAEIAETHPNKKVTLVSRSEQLCAALPDQVGIYCLRWLQQRGVEVLRGVCTTAITADGATLDDGRTLSGYGCVYNCAGIQPNTNMLRTTFGKHLDTQGRLLVNDHLSLEGFPHIFGAGDLMLHPRSNELKLGHTAELNAHVVAENVERLAAAKKLAGNDPAAAKQPIELVRYPEFTSLGLSKSPQVFCVSLGKRSAVLSFNGLVLGAPGGCFSWIAALVKWGLEWSKVASCEERPIGTCLWRFADFVTALLSATVVPAPERKAAEAKAP